MKLIPSVLASLLLSSAIGLPAFAADKTITIQLDQQKLNLSSTSSPINDHGTILLPMRSIFEKLGLKVEWNPATGAITGTKENLIIKLQVGSTQASVNGIIKKLTSAPRVMNNVTYVPLRFVGEATGSDIKWDAPSSTVIINSKQQTVDPKEITAFFEKYAEYSNKENYDGFMSLIDPKSPLAQMGPSIKDQMDTYDVVTTVDQVEIINLKSTEAAIHTTETTHNIKGPFRLDDKTDYVYALTRLEGSKDWKISNVQISGIQYILPEELLKAVVTVPKTEEDAINAVLQANITSSNDENINGVLATLDSTSPQFEQNKQLYGQIFKTYDLQYTLESTKIINYTENEAAVYSVQTTKKLKGPDFQDNRSVLVTTLKKSKDGKWMLEESYLIKSDKL